MQETTRLAGLIQERLDETIDNHASQLESLGPDALPLLKEARDYLAGGKRMRAQFAVLGFRAVQPVDLFSDPVHE
ncbi:MAG: polyprenyl synthetase family protein, partial [Leucobacter sp.]|nr:polyprenyl synthetase family protein [Leucobacter sp.]